MILKGFKLCKSNYLIIFFLDEFSCVTEQSAAQKGVFPYGKLRVKSGSKLQQRGNIAACYYLSLGRHHYTGHSF